MLLYILYLLAASGGIAYFNVGLDETFKAKERMTLQEWKWWMWFGILVLPIAQAIKFSALKSFGFIAYPALHAREQRMLDAQLKAAEEPVDPKLLAESEAAADRAAQGIPDPDPEEDFASDTEPEQKPWLESRLTEPCAK